MEMLYFKGEKIWTIYMPTSHNCDKQVRLIINYSIGIALKLPFSSINLDLVHQILGSDCPGIGNLFTEQT